MRHEIIQLWIQGLPWLLVFVGGLSLPFSTLFYSQYLRFTKRLWSPNGICGKLGGAFFGADWIGLVQSNLDKYEPTTGRKWANGFISLAMIVAGALWLWLRR